MKKSHAEMVEFINDPQRWPRWPVLPMKQGGLADGRAGFFITADYPTVLLREAPTMQGILVQLAIEDGLPIPGSTELQHVTEGPLKEKYESVIERRFDDIDQMLDAGWEPD